MYQPYYNALKALVETVTAVKTVDWDNEQWLNTEQEQPNDYPAVYIKFSNPMRWSANADGMKTARTSITLTVVGRTLEDSPADVLTVAEQVQKTMHRSALVAGNETIGTRLMLSSSTLNTRRRQLKVVGLTFDTTLYDYSTMPQRVEANASLKVEEHE